MDVTAEQAELISDDPRCELASAATDFRHWYQAQKEMRGLLTQAQAALLIGVSRGQVAAWVQRGRLSSRVVAGVRMVGGGEVAALIKERQTEIRSGGHKAPSLASLIDAAWEELEPVGK